MTELIKNQRIRGITNIEKMFKELEQAQKIINSLDGAIAELRFDPFDPASIARAISKMENAIDEKVSSARNNKLIDGLVTDIKDQFKDNILEKASNARLETPYSSNEGTTVKSKELNKIKNAVLDLQSSDSSSFDRHINKLNRAVKSDILSEHVQKLTENVDFDYWLENEQDEGGSFIGSAQMILPEDEVKELGTIIKLIEYMATDADIASSFAYTYFYVKNNYTANLQHFVNQILVPFERDFYSYVTNDSEGTKTNSVANIASKENSSNKVFIVHGHDGGTKETIARFLEKLDIEVVILHEQPNKGRTIIEKFEDHADVGFAIVLLTPDDEGRAENKTQLMRRARQNVILELGYFIGRLGRSKVCALTKGELELPSDILGIAWVDFKDDGAWRFDLAKELDAAGYNIDYNKAIKV